MPTYKSDWFFELQGQGWGETYYFQAASQNALAAAIAPVFDLRCRLLAWESTVRTIRNSDVAIQRDSTLYKPDSSYRFPETSPADLVGMCRRVRMEASSLYWRHLEMRGVPDDIFSVTVNPAQADFKQRFTDFSEALLGNAPWSAAQRCYIMALVKPTPPEVKVVTALPTTGTPGSWTITLDSALGVTTGDRILIYGAKGWDPPFRNLKVLSNAGGVTIDVIYPGTVMGTFNNNAYARKQAFAPQPVTFITDQGASHRNTGRPFGQQAGRRSR